MKVLCRKPKDFAKDKDNKRKFLRSLGKTFKKRALESKNY